ncbi:hypothetical protein BJ170DRAFT_7181 [Xylariales sp. AK1849]|nr:hypothetical protein BJ170DRAFT_7181 [Xylariales sp. AK1849]
MNTSPNQWSDGYARYSSWIAEDPDNDTFVFRKFDALGARNLLYLQCEIQLLEHKLKHLDGMIVTNGDVDLRDSARDWEILVEQASSGQDIAKEMLALVYELRKRIKEYQKALVLQSQVANLSNPKQGVLDALRYRLGVDDLKTGYRLPAVGGLAKHYLDDKNDLVAMKSTGSTDALSAWLRTIWPAKPDGSSLGDQAIQRFKSRSVAIAASVIDTLVAAILLIGAIVSFYFITNPLAKLLALVGFMVVFAVTVTLMTQARPVEIFAATAAYAAVLVVFVSGGDLSGC